MVGTPEHNAWVSLRQRCGNPRNEKYASYGGRGIKVCDRWGRFENFFDDMGLRPGPTHSLDRIDVNGDYEPKNCRWATPVDQANNKRDNHFLDTPYGRMTLQQASRKCGLSYSTILDRLALGMTVAEAMLTPKSKRPGPPARNAIRSAPP